MNPSCILTTVEETLQAIVTICERYNAKAWLFGSQARKTASPASDIDVAILSEQFDSIEEEIEEIDTVFLIDLVDLRYPHTEGIEHDWISIV